MQKKIVIIWRSGSFQVFPFWIPLLLLLRALIAQVLRKYSLANEARGFGLAQYFSIWS